MTGLSIWAAAAAHELSENSLPAAYRRKVKGVDFSVQLSSDSLWLTAEWSGGGKAAFRTAYAPGGDLHIRSVSETATGARFRLHAAAGKFTVDLDFPDLTAPLVRYTVRFTPRKALFVPFWPRDMIFPGKDGSAGNLAGKVHVSQKGMRTGMIYLSMTRPKTGSLLYFQNLSALNEYCSLTETSAAGTVGGEWPELGFALPPTKKKPIPAGKEVIISDAFVNFSPEVPADQFGAARQFVKLLAGVYTCIPRPETEYYDYPAMLEKAFHDLKHKKGCWSYAGGHQYLNAYFCDYDNPPEIMVQLAVLLPIMDYLGWKQEQDPVVEELRAGLPGFFDSRIGSVVRWLPAAEDKLDGSEEQKQPGVMDSWYLHHPLINLSRMAQRGDKMAKELFLKSLPYVTRVAHHFNYRWPVFYKMETLEVVKKETRPGEGGEKDVAGIYAHVMLQAYDLTGDKKYLKEAKRAARTLADYGFDLFYQANNTAFSAGTMLRLYKETGDGLYLDLSYLFLANLLKNVALWNCTYGYGKHFPTFFAIFPLNDAPYTAVYEEQEVFAAIDHYLWHAQGQDILPEFSLLLAEFIRYAFGRVIHYYPPMLPKDMLEEETKTGEIDPEVWIPLEDMHDGWEKSGSVGQEVYGAGVPFGMIPRHYIRIPGHPVLVHVDYPITRPVVTKKRITFTVLGSRRLACKLRVLGKPEGKNALAIRAGRQGPLNLEEAGADPEFTLYGDQKITITY